MRVLVGGAGSIDPVLREVVRRGHHVVALARSDGSARKVVELGAVPLAGKLFPDV
jgi:hypothetical protein